jgi:hypothetical protein
MTTFAVHGLPDVAQPYAALTLVECLRAGGAYVMYPKPQDGVLVVPLAGNTLGSRWRRRRVRRPSRCSPA